jgi:predicted AAA+ superfamily ATPase
MEIQRNLYLKRLIDAKGDGMIKIITGVRRCGKSYLLFNIFTEWLGSQGVDEQHIIKVNLEDRRNKKLRDPDALLSYIDDHISGDGHYFVLLDEVQLVKEFEDVLNSYLNMSNVDVYVTGSNAHFLSKDVITQFRGRGHEIHIMPLSFREFMTVYEGSMERGLDEYMVFGGLPQAVLYSTEQEKSDYLKGLFEKTYLTDIKERYHIRRDAEMAEMLNIISSSIGSLTNPHKLANTFASVKNAKVGEETIKFWLECLCDSFLISRAMRYDVKGRKYIDTPFKYYFSDMGLRNARINFRQDEKTHIMENVIYNELITRGFNVDVGVVQTQITDAEGKRKKQQLEIDFVCNQGSKRYYIQSAYRMESEEKRIPEQASLLKLDDSFKNIVVVGIDSIIHRSEQGITTMNICDFLLNQNSLEL